MLSNHQPSHRGVSVFDVKRVEKRVAQFRTTLTVDSFARTLTTGRGTGSSEDDKMYPMSQVSVAFQCVSHPVLGCCVDYCNVYDNLDFMSASLHQDAEDGQ